MPEDSYGTVAAIGDFPAKADFDARFNEHFKADKEFNTPGAYSGPRACVRYGHPQGARGVARGQPQADQRPSARASAPTRPTRRRASITVLGTTSFDKNGDTTQPFISFYVTDTAAKGDGDWVFKEQQNFAAK